MKVSSSGHVLFFILDKSENGRLLFEGLCDRCGVGPSVDFGGCKDDSSGTGLDEEVVEQEHQEDLGQDIDLMPAI